MKILGFLKNKYVLAVLLLLCFLFSTVTYLLFSSTKQLILFYPMDGFETMGSELRSVPRRVSKEEQIEALVKEVLLHPVHVDLNPIVPYGVRVLNLIYDEKNEILHLNLSDDLIIILEGASQYPDEMNMIEMLKENIQYHFSFLDEINITIEGMVPGKPMYMDITH